MIEYFVKYKTDNGVGYFSDTVRSAIDVLDLLSPQKLKNCSNVVLMQREVIEKPITGEQLSALFYELYAKLAMCKEELLKLTAEYHILKESLMPAKAMENK
jgi:hypothetical protein